MLRLNILVPLVVTSIIVIAEIAISFNSVLMPNIKDTFVIDEQLAQMTIGIGLFSLGFAGLIYGGLADSIGRRPIFIFSTVFFCITALVCALAQTIEVFLLARFLQGIGSGAGWVVGNACLRDVFQGRQYSKVMNYVHAIAGITPAIAPVIGSYLGVLIGWRHTFLVLFSFAALSAIMIFFFQPETLRQKKPFCPKDLFKGYFDVLKNQQYVRYLVVKVLTVMLIFTEVSNLPLIYVDYMGVLPQHYGFFVFPVLLVYVTATLISSKLCQRMEVDHLLEIGLVLLITSNVIILLLDSIMSLYPILIQSIKALSYMGWGFIFGNATAQIISAAPERSGAASAMMIALEMLFSSMGILFLGFFFNGTIIPLCWFMASVSLFCLLFMRFYERFAMVTTR